jgi:hypothetical protein
MGGVLRLRLRGETPQDSLIGASWRIAARPEKTGKGRNEEARRHVSIGADRDGLREPEVQQDPALLQSRK